jgi:hypothetical protein
VLGLLWLATSLLRLSPKLWESGELRNRSDWLAAYLIGIPSAYWLLERVAQFAW